jgi:hypothetical protein
VTEQKVIYPPSHLLHGAWRKKMNISLGAHTKECRSRRFFMLVGSIEMGGKNNNYFSV